MNIESKNMTNLESVELSSDEIIKNTDVVIAEGELLDKVKRVVAREYAGFMRAEERDEEQAYQDLCLDDFSDNSVTFVSLYTDPQDSRNTEILGSLRIVFGNLEREPYLEAMDLINIVDKETGASSWPHETLAHKVSRVEEVCEMGRFCISKIVRERKELEFPVTSSLLGSTYEYIKMSGGKLLIAIMPSYVYDFGMRNGTNLEKLNTNKEILFKNDDKAIEIRQRYPIYWDKLHPTLYVIDLYSYIAECRNP